ncbi:RDD family protein [Actinotalea solisilvae]|uniref:RDD family protein n=1 Tax=Actinotalea solisilvae TaxID=2072922 RepID=UPI0018F196A4|nr:RDD family protein [Actinotalea solisilvae]
MQDEIVIGEGVALDARPASFATRMLGALIDVVALGVLGVVLILVASTAGRNLDEAAGAALAITLLVMVLVVIPATVETLTRGRSLGKLALGLRIVRDDGGPIRVRHAVIRALVGVLELWFTSGGVAIIASLVHPKGKRLGDMLAGTYAVRVRGGQRALPPLTMPHELAAWARNADIRRLPDGLALSARQFLGRAATLHQASRVRLGDQIAGEMERYVAPGPPLGTHPERFIAAVLAERRDREFAHASEAARAAAAEAVLLHRLPHAVPDPAV